MLQQVTSYGLTIKLWGFPHTHTSDTAKLDLQPPQHKKQSLHRRKKTPNPKQKSNHTALLISEYPEGCKLKLETLPSSETHRLPMHFCYTVCLQPIGCQSIRIYLHDVEEKSSLFITTLLSAGINYGVLLELPSN